MTSRKPSLPVPVVRVDRDALAKALSLTPQRVSQLAKENVLAKSGRGEYDLYKSLIGYVRFLQRAMGSKATMHEDGALTTTRAQRSELLEVELAMQTMNLARARSETIAIADHRSRLVNFVQEAKARIMAIPAQAAPAVEMAKGRAAIEHAIKHECIAALRKLAGDTPPATEPPIATTLPAVPATKAAKPATKKPKPRARAAASPR